RFLETRLEQLLENQAAFARAADQALFCVRIRFDLVRLAVTPERPFPAALERFGMEVGDDETPAGSDDSRQPGDRSVQGRGMSQRQRAAGDVRAVSAQRQVAAVG